jgi:hypothetical protein
MLIEVCTPELHDALLGIAESRNGYAFDRPSPALLPASLRVPANVFTEVELLAIGAFRILLNYSEELCRYSFRQSRFLSLCSKMLDDRSSPCDPEVIVKLVKTVSFLVNHLADPLTANDFISCTNIFF